MPDLTESPLNCPSERRRAHRVCPVPFRVRLFGSEGTLIDISGTGALVRVPRCARRPLREITLFFELPDETLLLRGQVVRWVAQPVQLPTAVLTRLEHHVAVEFADLPSQAGDALRRLIERTFDSAARPAAER